MEKALNRKFGLKKKAKIGILLVMVIFMIMSVMLYFILYSSISKVVRKQASSSVANVSQLNADSVVHSLKNRQNLLETFAVNLAEKQPDDIEKVLPQLNTFAQAYHFHNIGVLTRDYMLYLSTGQKIDVSDVPQYREAMENGFEISESFMPVDQGNLRVNLLSVPVYYDGELKYIITATCYSIDLMERMNISLLDGKGYNFLLDREGNIVIYPKEYKDEECRAFMQYINDTSEIIPQQSEDKHFEYQGEDYHAHFEPLDINDWYLMTTAKEDDVFSGANTIIRHVFHALGILWIQLVAAMLGILFVFYRSKLRIIDTVCYDHLLGIGNGEYFRIFFQQLSEEQFNQMAFAMLDIDKFKEFNYIYGDESGDDLLKYIVHAFNEELPEDYIFRYLSDHFAILVKCDGEKEFAEKFERLLHRFSEDIASGVIQPFDVSAGVRKLHWGEPYRRIMSDALLAKGTVKGIQVQQYAFYDESLRHERMNFMEMESDFHLALRNDEFHVYYQPKYDMRNEEIIGAEALARWVKPDGTIVPPNAFIPCFEASRQIILLDERMLESVCRQMREMEEAGIHVVPVSVNLSRVHLKHHGILNKIERIIKDTGVDPKKLVFEITESALYEDNIPLRMIVDFLHQLGCRVDMDDYGMGVSGPNTLVTTEFDVVKLDKSFIDGIGDKKMEAVIRSTISLSKELGMDIIAEGVEEKYQADTLVSLGCYAAQGFYYSKPVPEAVYKEMLILSDKTKNT